MKSGTSLWATLGLCLVFASCGGMGNEQPGQEDPPQGQEMPEPLPGLEQEAPGGAAGGRYGGRSSERTRSRAAEASKAIQLGLAWLAQHQDENGRWSAAQFMKNSPKTSEPCTGPGRAMHDVGATGLALLAYLGDGNTLRVGPYREQVKKGVAWLRQQQQESGLIGESSGHAYMYNHGIATTAMVEAYGLSQYPLLKKNAQRALDYIAKARNPYKVWRYYPQDGQNDTSVTTWMVLALCAGRDFELSIDKDALKFAEAWFQEVTDPKTGQAGYTKRGEPSSRIAGTVQRFPPDRTEALTAAGLFVRILLGQTPETAPVLMSAADSMLMKPPAYDVEKGSIDYYYWFYGSMAMFQIGGKHWKKWREAVLEALLSHQREDGCEKGSWDPLGAWGEEGGRVYTTALAVLALESAYRYTRLIR